MLLSLAGAGASGELVCASPVGEFHVYLQEGRIAWATDSKHPFAFAAHLQDTAGIDVDTFRHVVEECRRERLPLGETLVEWGLTTIEGVRNALGRQVGRALELLATVDEVQALFLERVYRKYDDRLTFSIDEFVGQAPLVDEPAAAADAAALQELADRPGDRPELARQLRSSVEGLSWVEVFEDERVVDADPEAPGPRTPGELVRTTLLDGADFAAVRWARSSVVGLSVGRPRSLWCRISAESTFGAVVSAISSVAGVERALDRAPPRPDDSWSVGDADAPANQAIRAFMKRAQDVLAAVVFPGGASSAPSAGCGCSALELAMCVETVVRRRRALTLEALPEGPEEAKLDSIGFYLRTMVSGEARLWCFGAELEPATGETLWLFLDRRNSQGLGWAYLTALSRALARSAIEATP
jgi:hypothetical protein